jgi:hypothetical protein
MPTELGPAIPTHLQRNFEAAQNRRLGALERLSAVESVYANLRGFQQTLAWTARAEGATWDEIGLRLGVSKQAAQQRFGLGNERR